MTCDECETSTRQTDRYVPSQYVWVDAMLGLSCGPDKITPSFNNLRNKGAFVMTKISIISVNYKSNPLINDLEARLADLDVEYVVVDNSGDFRPTAKSTKVVDAGGNIGFGQGCNLGVRESVGEVVIFLNPDVEIGRESLVRLLEVSSRQEGPAIWGPYVRDRAHQVVVLQRPGRAGLSFRRRPLSAEELSQETVDVTYVSGACMVANRAIFEAIGGFSDEIFLYGEDLDLCIRAKTAGARIFLIGAVEIGHKGGGSSTKIDRIKRLFRSTKGHYTVLRHHHHRPLGAAINAAHLASGRRI